MHRLTTRLALLVVVGTMTGIAPVLAAPGMGNGPHNNGKPDIDCTLPENAQLQYCLDLLNGKNDHRPGRPGDNNNNNNNGPSGGGSNDNGGPTINPGPNSGPGNDNGFNGPGPKSGSFNWSQHDRDQFHRRFGGFDFGFFATPNFSIRLGIDVPHNYHLRPVPRSIYRFYPWFRGYLYFVDRRGDFVIVSPRSHRIVAIL